MYRYISILLIVVSQQGLADWVVPSERVTNGVTIRAGQGSQTDRIGVLRPGERLEWISDNGRWRAVRISQTQTGWVSKSWTRRISGTPGADAPLAVRQ